jgi:hypothetical protein
VVSIDVLRFFINLLILEGLFGDNAETREADDILHYISITVLSVFLAETSLLIISLGRTFFRSPGYVLDFVVVPTSFILEIVSPSSSLFCLPSNGFSFFCCLAWYLSLCVLCVVVWWFRWILGYRSSLAYDTCLQCGS